MAVDPLSSGEASGGRSIRWAAILVGVWLIAASLVVLMASGVKSPLHYQDEFLFWALARGIANGAGLSWRGGPIPVVAWLYPLVIAPAVRASSSVAQQYEYVKTLNSVLICAVVFPVYLGSRLLVSRGWALVAALFSIAVPAIAYAGLIGTEALAYPICAAALFAFVLAIARPSGRTAVLAIGLLLVAMFTRIQFAALAPVAVIAVAAALLFAPNAERRELARRMVPLAAALAALAAIALIYVLVRGSSAAGIYGSATGFDEIAFGDIAYWLRAYLADAYLVCGILPAIATLALLGGPAHRTNPALRALLAVALAATLVFVLQLTWFSSINQESWRERHILYERYLIYLAPLWFAGFAASFDRVKARAVLTSSAVAALILLAMPSGAIRLPFSLDALGQAYIAFVVGDHVGWLKWTGLALALLALLMGGALALAAREERESSSARLGRMLAILLPAFLLLITQAKAWSNMQLFSETSRDVGARPVDWIDRASGGEAAVLVGIGADPTAFYQSEFWNPSVARVFVSDEAPVYSPPLFSPYCKLLLGQDGKILPGPGNGCADIPSTWVVDSPSFTMRLRGAAPVEPRGATGFSLQRAAGKPQVLGMVGGVEAGKGRVNEGVEVRTFAGASARLRLRGTAGPGGAIVELPGGERRAFAAGATVELDHQVGPGDELSEFKVSGRDGASGWIHLDAVDLREGSGRWQQLF